MMIESLRKIASKVVVLGNHPGIIQSMLDYEYMGGQTSPSIVAIIATGRKQERFFWGESEITIPVVASPADLSSQQKETVTGILNVQSGRRVLSSTKRAIEYLPKLKVGVIFAEGTPELHALELAELCKQQQVLLIGPASVGLLLPGVMKLGAIGGVKHEQFANQLLFQPGNTAVVSSSGGMVNELIQTALGAGAALSFAMAIGGDRYPVTTPAEVFLLAQQDVATERILYFGELGGEDEYEIIELIRAKKLTKPVIAYIAGTVAELFETPPQFGHSKAMAQHGNESAQAKKEALREAGVTVLDSINELAPLLKDNTHESQPTYVPPAIGKRHKHLIVSHLSGDVAGDVHLLGRDMLDVVDKSSIASLVISMLLGESVTSRKLVDFTDYVLRVLADHGPNVSGAVNTIVAARAGRDLVSSLASGLLTVGPRFGGAVNEAAANWLEGVSSGKSPQEFVDDFAGTGTAILGIGHKKYSVSHPDPRLGTLEQFETDGVRPYLQFARAVEAITTAKKGNLILNVDGAIAAIMLDLLSSELDYDHKKLAELVDIEFFNALFVLSRSIGFTAHYLDQRRYDEGLLRLSNDEVAYIDPTS